MYKLVTSIEARIVFFGSFVFSMKFIKSSESFFFLILFFVQQKAGCFRENLTCTAEST